jgi:hypothetical protein
MNRYEEALNVRFDSDAGDDISIRQYIYALVSTLWDEEESFSGKRPFGNSGWQSEPLYALAKHGFVDLGENKFDEYFEPSLEQVTAAKDYFAQLIEYAVLGKVTE